MSDKNHEMIIKFNGVELSPEASERIQNGINNLLLQELASHQASGGVANDGDGDICGIYIPHKWIGRQVIPVNLSRPDSLKLPGANLAFIANVKGIE